MTASGRWPDERLDELNSAAGLTARIAQDTVTRVAVLETTVHTHGEAIAEMPEALRRIEAKLEARRVTPAVKLGAAVTLATSIIAAVALVLSSAPS